MERLCANVIFLVYFVIEWNIYLCTLLCIYVTLKLGRMWIYLLCFLWRKIDEMWNLLKVSGCTVKCGPWQKSDSQYYVVFCICCNLEGLLVTGLFLSHGTDRWIFVLLWIDHLINIDQIKSILWLTIWVQLFVMFYPFKNFNTVITCYLEFAYAEMY